MLSTATSPLIRRTCCSACSSFCFLARASRCSLADAACLRTSSLACALSASSAALPSAGVLSRALVGSALLRPRGPPAAVRRGVAGDSPNERAGSTDTKRKGAGPPRTKTGGGVDSGRPSPFAGRLESPQGRLTRTC
eukprot:4011469-Prymnesium_polylepis.1